MKISIAAFTARGAALAKKLAAEFCDADMCMVSAPARLSEDGTLEMQSLGEWTAGAWVSSDALILVGAAGIAVRAIAPHLRDKFTDPAVIAVDESGTYVIPLASGHIGGGNSLARKIADVMGGTAVITTATDVNALFAVDEWAARSGFIIEDRHIAKLISASLLDGRTVAFCSDFPVEGALPVGVTGDERDLGFCVTAYKSRNPFERTLRLFPKILTLGIGCRRETSCEAIEAAVGAVLEEHGLSESAVSGVATIDLKKDEPGLREFCANHGLPLVAYTAQELNSVSGDFTTSAFVKDVTGTDNVCERAAIMNGSKLLVRKRSQNGVTVAVAETACTVHFF